MKLPLLASFPIHFLSGRRAEREGNDSGAGSYIGRLLSRTMSDVAKSNGLVILYYRVPLRRGRTLYVECA